MERVRYERSGDIAVVTMDDGKVNAVSPGMIADCNSALDQAETDEAAVVLTGRAEILSAGFDLNVMRAGGSEAIGMLRGGFFLAHRLLTFPQPVVIASPGHAIAMGLFLLLSGDYRIGVTTPGRRFVANEVEIGLTVPLAATEICRYRMNPSAFDKATVLAHTFDAPEAVRAGILDETVEPDALLDSATSVAQRLAGLPGNAFMSTRDRSRRGLGEAVLAGVEEEFPLISE